MRERGARTSLAQVHERNAEMENKSVRSESQLGASSPAAVSSKKTQAVRPPFPNPWCGARPELRFHAGVVPTRCWFQRLETEYAHHSLVARSTPCGRRAADADAHHLTAVAVCAATPQPPDSVYR